jgi:hypothetical protein
VLVIVDEKIVEPRRRVDRIDVVDDLIGATLAPRRRQDEIATLALDLNAIGQPTRAIGDRMLGVPLEDNVRATGCRFVFARLERRMLGAELLPTIDAGAGVILGGVDVGHPYARHRPTLDGDQMFFAPPPFANLIQIDGRLVERTSAFNLIAVLVLVTRGHRALAINGDREDRISVLGIGLRGIEHMPGALVSLDRGPHRDPER